MIKRVCTEYVYAMIKQNSASIRTWPACQTIWTKNSCKVVRGKTEFESL